MGLGAMQDGENSIPDDMTDVDPILRFFSYKHLRPDLIATSRIFYDAALNIVAVCPRNPERTVALRKLLEAKDAAVRSKVYDNG